MRWVVIGLCAAALLAVSVVAAGAGAYFLLRQGNSSTLGGGLGMGNTVTVERIIHTPPVKPPEVLLVDDKLEDKNPSFDPNLVDRRPLGQDKAWLLNASSAVIKLDVPVIKPDIDGQLLTLHRSYAEAVKDKYNVLPSVNMVDGKAKQFDDGLYAALDLNYYRGLKDQLNGHRDMVRRMYERVGKDSPAAPYLAAGLAIGGVEVTPTDAAAKTRYIETFDAQMIRSKPIGFYTWSPELGECFRFLRFFQEPFRADQQSAVADMVKALAEDSQLLADYRKAMGFYARLTNPYRYKTLADLVPNAGTGQVRPDEPQANRGGRIAFFPASTSKETVLFENLFPLGLPPDADLMRELITAIRSGKVDLKPRPDSGWYDYQAYALETLLLPERGEENPKLMLTRAYKKRMLEAFQALITKRRETHVRQLDMAAPRAAAPRFDENVQPRLRVEPNPSYFLRTARAYAFLSNFLEATIGPEALKQMHGLKQGGQRELDLLTELHWMRDLYYGIYLVSAEDIGMKPSLLPDENVEQDRVYQMASDWLGKIAVDPDMAVDTRVIVPVFSDFSRRKMRCWSTLGVRLAKLEVNYVKPPSIKPASGEGDWKVVESHRLEGMQYLIPVDEFAEVELNGLKVLTREEFRTICDQGKTREGITSALSR